MSHAHKYKVLEYIMDKVCKSDDKIKYIKHLDDNSFYTHLFEAYGQKMDDLSLVVMGEMEDGSVGIHGVNMVLKQSEINNMYAFGQLGKVIDFVSTCYHHMKPSHIDMYFGLVSILRGGKTPIDDKLLIQQTAEKIKAQSTLAGHHLYHFVWERITSSVSSILAQYHFYSKGIHAGNGV
ncbi:hypothetical protein Ciccas_013579 [Cichlidogyrus casuarinus]|uniref:Uncharacterized protein n=1 Tax=Cichlidogyrus casuarinus TaxID=1844966 RepID=A0ABD2PQ92_9PLAT